MGRIGIGWPLGVMAPQMWSYANSGEFAPSCESDEPLYSSWQQARAE